jgi:predicted nucleic acid-binding protein
LTCVLDACALIAWLKNEPGEETIRSLLERAKNGKDSLYMNVINLLEVCYGFTGNWEQKKPPASGRR